MMLKQRLVSSISLWGMLILVVWFFKLHAVIILTILAVIGAQIELLKASKATLCSHRFNLILSVSFLLGYYVCARYRFCSTDWLYVFAIFSLCHWSIFFNKTAQFFFLSIFNFWYITLNLHFFLKIADLFCWENMPVLHVLIWIVLVTKLADTGGFCIGRIMGKHPLSSIVSPQKTWEGVLGGMLFATIGSLIFKKFFLQHVSINFSSVETVMFALVLSYGAMISDLLESLLKRHLHIKDSGKAIPGIGGVLDLIDSLLLNAPLAYILLKHCAQ